MSVLQDVRFAIRLLVNDRWFTAAAAVALALGIGVNNTVFTLMNAVLLRGLPFDDPDRIISIRVTDARGRWLGVSQPDFVDWRDGSRSFSELTLVRTATVNVGDEGLAPEPVDGSYNSANLFHVIGQHPIVGRDFRPQDDQPGADPVVILGGDVWKNRYGSDPGVIGRKTRVNGVVATVIGVTAPHMNFPYNNDCWMPLSMLPPELAHSPRSVRGFEVLGRLASGVTLAQARVELRAIAARLARDYPETNKDVQASVMTFNDRAAGTNAPLVFLALTGAVGFVLLIACSNVANLLLARSAQRSREIGIRMSLGAGRWRIVQQLLIESVVLAMLGGVLGLGLSMVGVRLLDAALSSTGFPYWMTLTMDRTVFAFLAMICLGTAVAFGLAPALHGSKSDFNEVLKDGGRGSTRGRRAKRWTATLMVAEIALTLVLLAGAGLMMRSVVALYRMAPGIDTSQLLAMRVNLTSAKYAQRDVRTALFQQLEERLRGIGTIQASALTTNPPMAGGLERQLVVEGRPDPPGTTPPTVTLLGVSTAYFDTVGMPVARGRTFTRQDGTPGHEVAIVNQRFVAIHFSGEDPIGQRIRLIDGTPRATSSSPMLSAEIVGVVPTMRQRNVREADPDAVIYVPYRVDPQREAVLLVRGGGDPAAMTSVVREQMSALEPDLPLYSIQTLDQLLAQGQRQQRVVGWLFATFAAIALVLSSVGLFAMTAYAVSQRTSEIGVRIALGARPAAILCLFLGQSLWQLAIGLVIGMAGALAVGRLLQGLLAQTSSSDPVTLVSTAVIMVLVSLGACFLPALRATRFEPIHALRYE